MHKALRKGKSYDSSHTLLGEWEVKGKNVNIKTGDTEGED